MECTLHVLADARARHACIAWGALMRYKRCARARVETRVTMGICVCARNRACTCACVSASMQMHRRMRVYVCAFVYTRMLICVYISRSEAKALNPERRAAFTHRASSIL